MLKAEKKQFIAEILTEALPFKGFIAAIHIRRGKKLMFSIVIQVKKRMFFIS